jgi:hypothetical protein
MGPSNYDPPAYKNLVLWLLGEVIAGILFYALFPYMPDFAQAIGLLVAVVVIWYDRDFPKRTSPGYATVLFWVPVALGLFCVVMWKVTGGDVWVRVGIACICVSAVYRITNWAADGWPA